MSYMYPEKFKRGNFAVAVVAQFLLLSVGMHCTSAVTYEVSHKIWHTFSTPYNFIKYCQIFKLFFTVRITRKFVVLSSLKIPPHLKCVATLPRVSCEMSVLTLKTRRLLQQHIWRVRRPAARWTYWTFDV